MADDPSVPISDVVTPDQIEGWKRQRVDAANELEAARQRIAPLQTKIRQMDALLKAAAPFVSGIEEWLADQTIMPVETPEDVPLTEAIKKILLARKVPPNPPNRVTSRDVIKARLPTVGYSTEKINANPNYFYTALKRLVERGDIVEGPPGNFRLK